MRMIDVKGGTGLSYKPKYSTSSVIWNTSPTIKLVAYVRDKNVVVLPVLFLVGPIKILNKRGCYNLEIKSSSQKDFIAVFSSTILRM